MIKRTSYHNRSLCFVLGILGLFISPQLKSQTVFALASPAPVNDTIRVCEGSSITFTSIAFGFSSPFYNWQFNGGNPAGANSSGPHNVTYNSAGNYLAYVTVADGTYTRADTIVVIVSNTPPTVVFNPPNTTICSSRSPFTPSGASPAGGTFFGPGVTNNVWDPELAGPGTHTICYTYTAPGGCSDTACATYTLTQGPDASISDQDAFTPFANCVSAGATPVYDLVINNISTTQATNVSYWIDWGDGSTPYSDTVLPNGTMHTYTALGIFDVTLVVVSPNGCIDTNLYSFFNGQNPNVGIGIGASQGCVPFTLDVPILNTTNNPPGTTYEVEFGDGTVMMFNHPPPDTVSYTYLTTSCGTSDLLGNPNSYYVRIRATNPCGTTQAFASPIEVSRAPDINLQANDSSVCLGQAVQLTDLSDSAFYVSNGNCTATYARDWIITPATGWTISGSGTPNPTVTFSDTGVYRICLAVQNPCGNDTACIDICVSDSPEIDIASSSNGSCAPVELTLWNQSQFFNSCIPTESGFVVTGSITWSTINGTSLTDDSAVFRFDTTGTYNVTYFAMNDCDSVFWDTIIEVGGPPLLTMPAPELYCELDTIDVGINWNNNGTPRLDTNGANVVEYRWSISPATGWTFMPGSNANSANPSIAFTDTGTYILCLAAETDCGVDSACREISFQTGPNVSISPDTTICYDESIDVGVSVLLGNPPYTYSWTTSPPSGFNATTDSISISGLTSTTTYNVTITDSLGCTTDTSVTVFVNPKLVANAGLDMTVCFGDTFNLNGSITGGTPPYSFYWNNTGLLSDSTILNPQGFGLAVDTSFILFITDSLGCTDADTVNVSLYQPILNVDAGPDTIYCNNNVVETLQGYTPTGGTWTGPGIVPPDGFNPSVAGVGAHQLIYTYTDGNGCVDRDTVLVTVINPVPPVAGPDTTVCVDTNTLALSGLPVGGVWTSNAPAGMLAGDQFVPNTVGSYEVYYTTGYGSCEQSDTIFITVNPRPTLGGPFSQTICSGDSVLFIPNPTVVGSSTNWQVVYSGSITGATVSGVGNITDTLFNPTQAVDSVIYEIWSVGPVPTLCEGDTTTLAVIVNPLPNVTNPTDSFEICSGDLFTFIPTSSTAGTTFQYVVVSADDSISGQINGTGSIGNILFNTGVAGYVHYRLYAFGPNPTNCEGDSFDVYVLVHPLPTANAGGDITYCHNDSAQLNAVIPVNSAFVWSPSTGLSNPNSPTSFVVLTNTTSSPIVQNYILTITDTVTGCVNTDTVSATINPLPPADAGPNRSICIGDSTLLGTGSSPAYSYSWIQLGSGPISNAPTHYVRPIVTTSYRLVQTDTATGCMDSSEVTVTVIPAPVAGFIGTPDSSCSPVNIAFTDTSTPGVSHQWFVNGTLFSNTGSPSLLLTNTSNNTDSLYTIDLIITAGSGCSDTATQTIVVHPLPDASFFIPTTFCAPDTVQAQITGLYPLGSTFQWYVNSSAVNLFTPSDSTTPISFADNQSGFDSTYTVSLSITSPNGCVDSVSQLITVYSTPIAGFSIPPNSCGPASINVQNTASGNALQFLYRVSPNNGIIISDSVATQPSITFPASFNDSVVYTVVQLVTDSRGCEDSDTLNFTIYPTPTADFQVALTDSCGPFTVQFNNRSTANQAGMDTSTMSFQWNFGNGQVSTQANPLVTFNNTGTTDTSFTVVLIASNEFDCADTIRDTITVHPDPRAEFTAVSQSGCAPFTVDTSSVNVALYPSANQNYTWEVLDNAGSILTTFTSLQALNYTLLNDGDTIQLRLVVTSPFGCANDTTVVPFYSIEDPVAGFIALPDSGCHPLSVQMTDTSTTGVTHEWFVNGVSVSNAQNPSFNLTNTSSSQDSIYTIQLIVTAASGCADTTEQDVVVWANPVALFTATEVCDSEITSFTDQSSGVSAVSQWNWDFGDGSTDTIQSPIHTYSTPGTYLVTLSITDARGCVDAYTDTVIVRPLPVATFDASSTCGQDTLCINLPSTFFSTSTLPTLGGSITAYYWDVDEDGITDYTTDSVTHVYSSSGDVDVRLIVESQYGCVDTIIQTYHILAPPDADIRLDTNYGCGPLQVTATNLSTGTIISYAWDVYALDGSGNRVSLYSANTELPGTLPQLQRSNIRDTTYYIELVTGNCCGFDTVIRTATVRSNPSAGILPDNTLGCSPMSVEFQLDGQVNGSPDYLVIDYGDGTVDTVFRQPLILPNGDTTFVWGAQNHLFLYNGPNLDTTYTVSQYVYNPCGVDSTTVNITVRSATVNAFIDAAPRQGCAPLTVTFANASFRSLNFTWCLDFDTITGNCSQPAVGDTLVYTYNQPGTYTVALFANDGCTFDTTMVTIEVFDRPNVSFTANEVCLGDSTLFTNNTTLGNGFISSYAWDFGDGNTSFLVNPSHIYAQPGIYTVTLVVNTTDGCPDTATSQVQVYPGPIVDFVPVELCLNELPYTLDNLTDTVQIPIASTLWDLGDGTTSKDYEPTINYTTPGVYEVKLTHITTNGCIDSTSYSIIINQLPTAAFDTTKLSEGNCGVPQTYSFTNQSSGANRIFWDFDTNNPGTLTDTVENPQITYTTPGVYPVQLIVESATGCVDTAITQIVVPPYPVAEFSIDTTFGCAPLTVMLTSMSQWYFPLGSIVSYYWDFGDGSTEITTRGQVTHVFDDPGTFDITLVVESSFGCADTFVLNNAVRVYPQPIAEFIYQIIGDGTVSFINQSQLVDGNTTFTWDFGDGNISTETSPTHDFNAVRYENDLYFDVCLKVDNPYGCPDSICITVELLAYRLVVPNAFAPDLTGVGDGNVFLPKGNNIAEYHLEVFDAYGNLVFETTELTSEEGIPNEPWNGTFMNQGEEPLPQGAYVWKISAVFIDGYIWPGKVYGDGRVLSFGTVTLIR